MDKALALKEAGKALELLIENQQNLFNSVQSANSNRGSLLADYCHDFMEQYAKRLMDRTE